MRQGLYRRLQRLEETPGFRYSAEQPRERFRIVVTGIGWTEGRNESWSIGPLNLEQSTCRREFKADGTLWEIVQIHGNWNQISDEQLEQWIAGCPVERV